MTWILLPFVVMPYILNAQGTGKILSSTLSSTMPGQNWTDSYLNLQRSNLPLFQKIEVRSELDRLLYSRQEYLARATFNSLRQRRSEENKMRAYATWKSSEQTDSWRPVILQAYKSILTLQSLAVEVQITDQLLQLANRKDSLYQVIAGSGREIDLASYIELKQEMQELEIQRRFLIEKWKALAAILDTDTTMLSPDIQWCSIDQLETVIDRLKLLPETTTALERDYLDASASVLRADSRRWLDFVQARYTVRDDLLLQNRFSLGVGLTIPWNGSTGIKTRDIAFRKEQITEEARARDTFRVKRLAQYRQNFNNALKSYRLFRQYQKDSAMNALKEKYLSSGKADPLKWIDIQRREIKRLSREHQDWQTLWELYIDILDVSGALYKSPFINYFYGPDVPIVSEK